MEFILWFVMVVFMLSLTLAAIFLPWALWWVIYDDIFTFSFVPRWFEYLIGFFTGLVPLSVSLYIIMYAIVSPITPVMMAGPFKYIEVMRAQNELEAANKRHALEAMRCTAN